MNKCLPNRRNLDPVSPSVNTDEDLWHALEVAQLKDVVSPLDGGLGNVFFDLYAKLGFLPLKWKFFVNKSTSYMLSAAQLETLELLECRP